MRGDRSRQSAKKLWASLPGVYRQCAVAYTDFWESYKTVIPSKRHRAVGKETGQTNQVERLNNTCRQRISRLVRESLSFHYYRITTISEKKAPNLPLNSIENSNLITDH